MPKPKSPATGSERVLRPGFQERVFDVVRQIPEGKVASYGQIATLLGYPGVARHVGNALAACGNSELPVPWHRVVNARGGISTRGAEQRQLLESEGVVFTPSGLVDLSQHRWQHALRD